MSSPTLDDVRSYFNARMEAETSPPDFHPADLERVKDDKYITRVLRHSENDAKAGADLLWDILVWRKSVGASDLNESNINLDYCREGGFFPHGRDIDGSLLLIFKSKLHFKGQKDFEELKKCIIYWFDRIEREENGKKITLFFDMDGCGLSNMDMEFIKYLIQLIKYYYPYFLNYIIIYQMPWVLSAAFKVIKSLLPAKAVEKMKFLNKDNIKDYVPLDQALVCWGGTDDYVFEFVPENRLEQEKKKVTFAEQNNHSPGEILKIQPNDTIVFKEEKDDLSGQFTITNMDLGVISFKIRTTSPEKFRVRPSSGTLTPGASQTVMIVVQPGFQMKTVTKDRFLVMAVPIPKADLTQKEIADIWQKSSGSKVDEYRLKCNFPEKEVKNGPLLSKESEKTFSNHNLNTLQKNYDYLNRQLKTLKILQFITLTISIFAVVLGYLIYTNNNSSGYCERM